MSLSTGRQPRGVEAGGDRVLALHRVLALLHLTVLGDGDLLAAAALYLAPDRALHQGGVEAGVSVLPHPADVGPHVGARPRLLLAAPSPGPRLALVLHLQVERRVAAAGHGGEEGGGDQHRAGAQTRASGEQSVSVSDN